MNGDEQGKREPLCIMWFVESSQSDDHDGLMGSRGWERVEGHRRIRLDHNSLADYVRNTRFWFRSHDTTSIVASASRHHKMRFGTRSHLLAVMMALTALVSSTSVNLFPTMGITLPFLHVHTSKPTHSKIHRPSPSPFSSSFSLGTGG